MMTDMEYKEFMGRMKRLDTHQKMLLDEISVCSWVVYDTKGVVIMNPERDGKSDPITGRQYIRNVISFPLRHEAFDMIKNLMGETRVDAHANSIETGTYVYTAIPKDEKNDEHRKFFIEQVSAKNILRLRDMAIHTFLGEKYDPR